MSDTTDLAGVPGMKRVELTQADIDKWAPHAERIRGHLSIAAGEMINIGKYLIEVKTGLDHGKFLHWIWREFEMTDRTARRFMSVAAWVEGKSDTVSNLQPSVLYLLASSETPSEITDDVITRAEKGENIKAAEVKRQIQKAKAESTNVATTEGEAPETELSIETAIAYFKEPATSREHGIRKIREHQAFADHVAADADRAAQEECTEPEPSGKPSRKPRKPTKAQLERQELEAERAKDRIEVCDILRKLPRDDLERLSDLHSCWMDSAFDDSAEWLFVLAELDPDHDWLGEIERSALDTEENRARLAQIKATAEPTVANDRVDDGKAPVQLPWCKS